MAPRKWNIANLISLYRILAIPVLITMIILDNRVAFTVLLVISLVSDILDGYLARKLNLGSELGARLDSIGDMSTFFVTLLAVVRFEWAFVVEHYIAIAVVIGLYLIEVIFALIKFKKISSFHTIMCKVTAYAQGIFLVTLFSVGFVPWIFYPTIVIACAAYVEEIIMIAILKENVSNVGGVRAVMGIRY